MIIFVLKKNSDLFYSVEYQEKTIIFNKDTCEIETILDYEVDILKDYSIVDYLIHEYSLEDKLMNKIYENYR